MELYQRLDRIDAPQFGLTLDRRVIFGELGPLAQVERGGPVIQPAASIPGDWTVYVGRQAEVWPNVSAANDRIEAIVSIGTGQTALQYREIPEVPAVGIAMHFASQVTRVAFRWTNPAAIGAFQPIDRIVSWACPGRPSFAVQRRRIPIVTVAPAMVPPFVIANGQAIPMFSVAVTARLLRDNPATPYFPFFLVFADIGGSVVDWVSVDPLANGSSVRTTIPGSAAIVIVGTLVAEVGNVALDFEVNA